MSSLIKRIDTALAGPWTQVLIISFVCFCCPGMFNALSGVGGGGQVSPEVASNASVGLSAASSVFSMLVCGPLLSVIGPRTMMLVGAWTYPLYSGSLLTFNHHGSGGFVIASGTLLGVGAGCLWIAQGTIMTGYVKEKYRGRAFAVFWFIFNVGGTIGSLISFGLNFHSSLGRVSDSTYIAFLVIMVVGWLMGVFLVNPRSVRNDDIMQELALEEKGITSGYSKENVKRAFVRLFYTLWDWRVACMLPLFFAANMFYPYQQSVVNVYAFNIRTRSLNSALYWMAQMFGGLVMGGILDLVPAGRRMRGIYGWVFLFITGMAIWGGGLAFENLLEKMNNEQNIQNIDFKDGSKFLGPMFLYMFYGAYDSFWQSYCYWLLSALSNSPYKLAVYVGCYKSIQGVGAAMTSRLNALGAARPQLLQSSSWRMQFILNWAFISGAMIAVLPVVWAITETSHLDDAIVSELVKSGEIEEPEEKTVAEETVSA